MSYSITKLQYNLTARNPFNYQYLHLKTQQKNLIVNIKKLKTLPILKSHPSKDGTAFIFLEPEQSVDCL
jgi:hypothetical protein